MRVLMYSPDSIGLGHMRRNATIAAEIVRQCPRASVALLIGSGAGAFFSVPKGVDTIKLPSVQKVAAEKWQARSLNLSADETSDVRAGIIANVICSLKPDVLLVDHLPMGVCQDLVPALRLIRDEGFGTQVVLGLRDILDEPEVIKRRWQAQALYRFIADNYDAGLIYGERDVYPSSEHYGLDECLPGKITYTGFVCSSFDLARDTRGEKKALRSLAGLGDWCEPERIIIAAGGGGHDAYPMLSTTLGALARLESESSVRSVVIAGPLMPEPNRRDLERACEDLSRTRLVAWTADCMDYLSMADVAVVMAGYNSSLEALSTSANIIMLPREGPSGEQRIRARMLASRNLVDCIEAGDLTSDRIEQSIRDALARPPRRPATAMLSGASVAANRLITLAQSPKRNALQSTRHERSPYVLF